MGGEEVEGGRDGERVLPAEEENEREDFGLGAPSLVTTLILFLTKSLTYMSLEVVNLWLW